MINLTLFKPQLVGEGNVNYFLYHNEVAFIEPKIDGIRIICQKDNDEIKLFTRGGQDWTNKFTSIIPKIKEAILPEKIVIDGELALMKNNTFLSSTEVLKKKYSPEEKLVYFAFDILQADDIALFDESLLSRKQNLQLSLESNDQVQIIPATPVNNTEDVNIFYKKILEKGFEGIVLKNLKQYIQNSRYNWIKLKPLKTIDLRIIDKKERKDNNGWIYTLADNKNIIGTVSSTQNINTNEIVEVAYDSKFQKLDFYRLRFPRILRVRKDKQIPL